jgi:quercetin dioxygenase-like cupin family protein
MRRLSSLGIGLLLAVGLLAAVAVMPSLAQDPIVAQPLTGRAAFTDDVAIKFKVKVDGGRTEVVNLQDASLTQTVMFTVQPGAMFPWHSHPGSVVVNVVSGELVYVTADTCGERHYAAGEAFFDPGHGHVHTAFNPGTVPTVLVATFFGLPATGPLSNPVTPPAGCVVTP